MREIRFFISKLPLFFQFQIYQIVEIVLRVDEFEIRGAEGKGVLGVVPDRVFFIGIGKDNMFCLDMIEIIIDSDNSLAAKKEMKTVFSSLIFQAPDGKVVELCFLLVLLYLDDSHMVCCSCRLCHMHTSAERSIPSSLQ